MIEFKYSEDVSVYFTPLENGQGEYDVTVHDFCQMDKVTLNKISRIKLDLILLNPNYAFNNVLRES